MILKILTQGSPLVVLVVVVYLFLRYLKDVQSKDREMFKGMHEDHLEARKEIEKAFLENAASTRDNTKAIQSLEQSVMKLLSR